MQSALGRFPFMRKRGGFTDDTVSLVCYGPSLNDTWKDLLPRRQPIVTVSGAHDFLVEKGIVPTWHVDIDPRQSKAAMLTPQMGTKYLMASVCHPDVWDILDGFDVELWHLINGNDMSTLEWVAKHHPAGLDCMFGGGSTAGQRAMNVATGLGFRKFDVYGMDCSFAGSQHAGRHTGTPELEFFLQVQGKMFKTSPQLSQAAREMSLFLQTMDAEVRFHGEGLMQSLAKIIQEQKTP